MDEWMLNDLLECSVCLERLDTSSKVLPCQHTFCKKCLEEIVTTHKELRCPECRVLVDIKIDDLPPNVLLMRILEGMRNAAPKKRNSGSGVAPRHHMSPPQHHYQHQQQHYHPPQQPPPSLQPQHHLPTSVSSSGSSTLPLTNPNPILQIPRFCYTPNQHILLPRLGKSDCNNFPTVLATGHAVPATITLNHPTVGHQVPASNPTILTPTGPCSFPNLISSLYMPSDFCSQSCIKSQFPHNISSKSLSC
ncbi:hypothetical protein LSTR_LSTR015642 [Laodelphax striatellus]|uniref:RING-type domain-containing protein n=1 Tax=Laodelphax striatellus TaxID=195883 RepID=A0A482WSJ4_LAOST|nr:hypothetical protein LSTR_LSTR015642 [Laodelphax striatellus]